MKAQGILISSSRTLRSSVFTLLSISAPFYLDSLRLNYIEIGLILLLSAVTSTVFIYLIPRLKMTAISKIFLTWGLLSISLIILVVNDGLPEFILALLIGGLSLTGKDMSPNASIEQYTIGSYYPDQREKNNQFSYYNFLSYGGNMAASLAIFIFTGLTFSSIFMVGLILTLAEAVPYMLVRFPNPKPRPKGQPPNETERKIVSRLTVLFGADSFGGGFVNTSMLSLWFLAIYSLKIQETGLIFVVVNLLTMVSVLISGRLSTRIGLIRTMVSTHLVSNAFLIMMSFVHVLFLSEIFLFLRQTTSQMDVPARDSFINTIIEPDSRMYTNSHFLAARNISNIPSPAVGGLIIDFYPLVLPAVAGAIKSVYDVALYAGFRKYKV
jgi:MFS-type transporter involved in bile tolerance (Atg22 family)